jgi:hypothetical protein
VATGRAPQRAAGGGSGRFFQGQTGDRAGLPLGDQRRHIAARRMSGREKSRTPGAGGDPEKRAGREASTALRVDLTGLFRGRWETQPYRRVPPAGSDTQRQLSVSAGPAGQGWQPDSQLQHLDAPGAGSSGTAGSAQPRRSPQPRWPAPPGRPGRGINAAGRHRARYRPRLLVRFVDGRPALQTTCTARHLGF